MNFANILLYFDPGSGSMLVQLLIAGAVGVAMFFQRIKMAVLGLFRGKKRPEEGDGKA